MANLLPLTTLLLLLPLITTLCPQSCQSCTSTSSCLQCTSSTYIAIASQPVRGCLPCRPGCKTCSSEFSVCGTCAAGYYMDGGTAGKCVLCGAAFCEVCDAVVPEVCTSCTAGYYLIEASGTCQPCSLYPYASTCRESMILSCQPGFYVSGGQKCLACTSNCLKCTSPTFCSQCRDGYYGSNCTACHASCQTCIRSTACLTCKSGMYMNGPLCGSCPNNSANPMCINCDSSLKCTICSDGYYLDETKMCLPLVSKITACIRYETNTTTIAIQCKECQTGYYLSPTNHSCLQCSLLCSSCTGFYSTSSCTACIPEFSLPLAPGICTYNPINPVSKIHQNTYINQWNFPTNYTYLGTTTTLINENCPSWKLSTRMRLKVGIINGYDIGYRMKITFSVPDVGVRLGGYGFTIGVNNVTLGERSLGDVGDTISQCSGSDANRSSTQFTQIVMGSLGNFDINKLAPANTALPGNSNYFQLISLTPNFSLTISQLVLTYHPCHPSCSLCVSDTECLLCRNHSLLIQQDQCVSECDQFYYLHAGTCVRVCPMGTYANPYADVWECTRCFGVCTRCVDAARCLSCGTGYFLLGETCVQICPVQYWANTITSRCQPCSPPCFTCSSAKNCLSCSYNFLYNSTCLSSSDCPSGYYPQLLTMSCIKCAPPCQTCISQSSCTSCLPSSGFLYNSKCHHSCPVGYLPDPITSTCNPCSPLCYSCWNTTDYCLKCNTGFLLDGRCLANCPTGLFQNYTTMECSLCRFPCLTCRGSPNTCLLCAGGYILHDQNNVCLLESQCLALNGSFLSVKYVMVPSTSNSSLLVNKTIKSCTKCPSQCLTCISPSQCLSCQPSFYLLNAKCIINCPFGYYSNKKQQNCLLCSSNCATCMYEANFCTSCPQNARLNYQAVCESGCLEKDQLEPTCEKCSSPCYQCVGQVTHCESCVPGYYLNYPTRECLSRCYDGYYSDHLTKKCLKCNETCLTCINSSSQCTSCPGSSYLVLVDGFLKSGDCILRCPSRFFPQILSMALQMCQACQEPCLQCEESSGKCVSCLAGVLNVNECIPQCPSDKYLQISNSTCQPCSPKCLLCFGSQQNQCYSCRQGYYFLEISTSCVSACPMTYISSTASSKCEACQFPCLECKETTTSCTKCWEEGDGVILYYLNQRECLSKCPSLTYAEGNVCKVCKFPCLECLATDYCLTCQSDHYFLQNTCNRVCPSGYFPDPQSQSCIKCSYPCKACLSQTECLTCIDGIRLGSSCSMIDQCLAGEYLEYSETNGICRRCAPECKQCVERADRCTLCDDSSLILFGGRCVISCPGGLYRISSISAYGQINTCTPCPPQCLQCTNDTNCTVCSKGYNQLSGRCIEQCPPTHYNYRMSSGLVGLCVMCSPLCRTCVNGPDSCLSCHEGYFLDGFRCLLECQVGTYKELYQASSIGLTNSSIAGPTTIPNNSSYNQSISNYSQINTMNFTNATTTTQKQQGVCRQCIFPCRQCLNSRTCVHCLNGYFLMNGSCIQECNKPMKIYYSGSDALCVRECPQSYKYTLDLVTKSQCSTTCMYPYILSQDALSCLQACPTGMYISEHLQCQPLEPTATDIIPKIWMEVAIDRGYQVNVMVYFGGQVRLGDFWGGVAGKLRVGVYEDLLRNATMSMVEMTNYGRKGNTRLLTTDPLATEGKPVQFRITKLTQNYLILQLNPQTLSPSPQNPQYLTLQFMDNANLLLRDSLSSIPIQSSHYTALVPRYEAYPNQYEISSYFAIFGQVLVIFLLIIGAVLLLWNWYAKVYESLHFCQLVFLMAMLEVQYPPNLWLFLQGFKNAHFYFIGNSFISNTYLTKISQTTDKIGAILTDSNFIRTQGHILCLILILLALSFILFVSKYLTSTRFQTVNKIATKLYTKFKLIKWSHIHDLAMTITLPIFFGFGAQTFDYSSNSVMQILGIILSYVCVGLLMVYHGYIAYKLYRIVRLSQQDPRRFCDKKYLFRSNMLSITESAVHPQQLYLNNLRACRIIVFGTVLGLFSTTPMLCCGCILTVLLISALVYLIVKPYPDPLQNGLLGIADLCSCGALLFVCLIFFSTVSGTAGAEDIEEYLRNKWRLGWVAIIFVLLTAFLLLAQLLVSIVKGNFSPLKLSAEDPKEVPAPLLNGAPKNIEVSPKKCFVGWQVNQDDKVGAYAYKYQAKEQ